MFFWSLQITIISITMIFLVHHLLNFFKNTLTVPKVRDLVNIPQQKYDNIYNILNAGQNLNVGQGLNVGQNLNVGQGSNSINNHVKQEAKIEISSMKNELKSFLKKQLQNGKGNTTSIDTLDSFSNTNNYSIY
jgi:hypothetical protein